MEFQIPAPKPPRRRARLITTAEGKYLFLGDLKRAVQDEALMQECLALLKVGHDCKDRAPVIMSHVIGYFVASQAGEAARFEEEPTQAGGS